jgi:hypothetical protein
MTRRATSSFLRGSTWILSIACVLAPTAALFCAEASVATSTSVKKNDRVEGL